MRKLILALSSVLLMAQGAHYEGTTLVSPMFQRPAQEAFGPIRNLCFTEANGRTHRLELPPHLDGTLGESHRLAHFQGVTYALAVDAHFAVGLSRRRFTGGLAYPFVLLESKDGLSWHRTATLATASHYFVEAFLPMGQGRFLLHSSGLFRRGQAVSPLAVFGVEAGRLQLERLVDLGPGLPWNTKEARLPWQDGHRLKLQRVPEGFLVLHPESGRCFVLDGGAAQVVGQGRVWDGGKLRFQAMAGRPDGRVLLAAVPGGWDLEAQGLGTWMESGSKLERPLDRLVASRLDGFVPWPWDGDPMVSLYEGLGVSLRGTASKGGWDLPFRWFILDPRTAQVWEVPPPKGLPKPTSLLELAGFAFEVRHDGNVEVVPSWVTSRASQTPGRWKALVDRLRRGLAKRF